MQRASSDQQGSNKESFVLNRAKSDLPKEEKSFVFNKKYTTTAKIHSTTSVDIYLGLDITTKQQIALKIEKENATEPTLYMESRILNHLKTKGAGEAVGIPKALWFGTEEHDNEQLNILAMELVGPSLGLLLQTRTERFSLKTTLMLADQMIKRIEFVHTKGYLHRDIKPHNFAIGLLEKSSTVYLVNYSACKHFKNLKTDVHRTYAENKPMVGSANFASINCHLGVEPSRRDDLESLGYTLVYLVKGSLPWQNTHGISKAEKVAKIMDKKMSIPPELLCKGLPDAFPAYLNYCKSLKYDEKPDYKYLRELFRRVMAEKEYVYDNYFDWVDQSMNADMIYEYRDLSISFKRPSSGIGDMTSFSISQPFEKSRILLGARLENDPFSQQSDESSLGVPNDVSISTDATQKLFPSKGAIMPMTSEVKIMSLKGLPKRYYTTGNEEFKDKEDEKLKALLAVEKTRTYENKRSFDEEKKYLRLGTDSTTNKTISLRIPELADNKGRSTVCNVFLTDGFDSECYEKENDKETISHYVSMQKDMKQSPNKTQLGRAMTMGKAGYEDKHIIKRSRTAVRAHTLHSKDSGNQEFESEFYQSFESRDLESEPKFNQEEEKEEDRKGCAMF